MQRTSMIFVLLITAAITTPAQQSTPAQQEPQSQDTVLVLLDCSGSMDRDMKGGRKMDVAKAALKHVAENFIAPGTNVGLLTFEARGLKDDWVYPLGPFDKQRFLDAIRKPEAGGGTPLGKYMENAADALIAFRAQHHGYGEYKLLVVTDGEAQDSALVDEIAPRIKQRGFILDAIGVAMDQSHTIKKLADHYADANSPEELARAIQQTFAEVNYNDPVASAEAYAEISGLDPDIAKTALSTLSSYTSLDHRVAELPKSSEGGTDPAVEDARDGMSWLFIVLAVLIVAGGAAIVVARNRR